MLKNRPKAMQGKIFFLLKNAKKVRFTLHSTLLYEGNFMPLILIRPCLELRITFPRGPPLKHPICSSKLVARFWVCAPF